MVRWRYLALLGPTVLIGATPALAAYPWPTCRGIFTVTYKLDGYGSCTPPERRPSRMVKAFDCTTGAPKQGCNTLITEEWVAFGGYRVGQEPCEENPPGPVLAITCGEEELPKQCPASEKAARDSAGLLGDPVDVTSGSLGLTPTDVDLGGGLAFRRHYSSLVTATGAMGRGWRHGLDWRLVRTTVPVPSGGTLAVLMVFRPFDVPVVFAGDYAGLSYVTSPTESGFLAVDPGGAAHYVADDGTEVDFDASDRVVALRVPGELPVAVSYGTGGVTWSNGEQSLEITHYGSGHANEGRVATVTANGETWTYGYDASQNLTSVTGPDPSTPSPSDTITWTYVYSTPASSGRVVRLDRTVGSQTTTLGAWTYGGNPLRVTSADEPALEQPLLFSYQKPATAELRTTVKNASNEVLARFDSQNELLTAISNPSGPEAPVAGGPGVSVAYASAVPGWITGSSGPGSPTGYWETKTDANGHVTLYEGRDGKGRPTRVVEGWVDGLVQPGVFSPDDTWARVRETTWHPLLDEPLTVIEESPLTGGLDKVTIYDYDDLSDAGDDPFVPNENPTKHLFAKIEAGSTLDATGAIAAVSAVTRYTYDADGRLLAESGPRAENHTEFVYDPATGYRTAVRRYLNGPGSAYLETTFSDFDARGNPETVTDPNGRETTFTYDGAGRVKTMTPPFAGGDSTITSTYDVDANLARVDFPDDSFGQPYFVRMGYDAKSRMTFLADAQGNAIVYERTGGRVTREALYAGFVDLANRGTLKGDSTFGYDAAGRMLKAFNPLFGGGTVFTEYDHDAKGNVTEAVDENGREDNLLYDALDRLAQVEQVRGGTTYTTGFEYDVLGNVKQVTDPAGKDTDYLFDDLGRLVKVTSPNTGTTLYVYDLAGNLTTKVEDLGGTGRTTTYTYDGLDRLTLVDFETDPSWVLSYDTSAALNQKGRLASASNGVVTTELEYTAQGQLAVERTLIGGGSYPVTYTYDASGKLATLTTPRGVTTTYAYSGSRPKEVTVTAGSETQTIKEIAYLPFGPRTHAELPPEDGITGDNTVISTRQYNLRYQVTEIDVTTPSETVLDLSYTYDYTAGSPGPVDPGPNLDRVIDHRDASESRFYFYDELDRLWKATDLSGSPIHTYLYEPNGNRTQQISPAGTTSYGYASGTDLLAQATGAEAKHYASDPYGSRIWSGASAYAGTPSLVHDEGNRLVEVRDPTTLAVLGEYTYDAFGRRVRKIAGGATTLFFYGPSPHLVEEQVPAGSPATARTYVYLEDEPAGVVDQAAGGTPAFSWVHGDHLTTPRAVTSAPTSGNAAVVWRATYTPFGLAEPDEDPDGDLQTFALDLRFPGHQLDPESGLHYVLLRILDAATGRYLEADPLGLESINPFPIANNNPLSRVGSLSSRAQVDNALDVLRRNNFNLDVPRRVDFEDFPGNQTGLTTFWGNITIDDRYLRDLDCKGLYSLLRTLIHESIHRTQPWWDKMRTDPRHHPHIYRRTEEIFEALYKYYYDLCACLQNPLDDVACTCRDLL